MKGFDIRVGDAIVNTHSGEHWRVIKAADHYITAVSSQFGNQAAIPRHQFVDGDFQLVEEKK